LKNPIRHRDVKSTNVLIDGQDVVLLADFDIAKKYANVDNATTQGPTAYTPKTSPQNVKDGEVRSFDSDIFGLACVFLEVATVIFGQTRDSLYQHLAKGCKNIAFEYSQALEEGTIKSWIDHLKQVVRKDGSDAPLDRFGDVPEVYFTGIDAFLDQIWAMLNVTIDTHKGMLEEALTCFSCFSPRKCLHCQSTEVSSLACGSIVQSFADIM